MENCDLCDQDWSLNYQLPFVHEKIIVLEMQRIMPPKFPVKRETHSFRWWKFTKTAPLNNITKELFL